MEDSEVLDIDGTCFPDPLSINYDRGNVTKLPTAHTITARDLVLFWITVYEKYGLNYYGDLVLNENGIPYIGMLEPGDTIYLPDSADLTGFITSAIEAED